MNDTQEAQPSVKQVTYDLSLVPMLGTKSEKLLAVAKAYKVTTPAMFEAAGDDLKAIKAQAKTIEDARTSITVPLNAALKNVNDLFRAPAKFCEDAEKILKGAMTTYTVEEQRKAAEEQRKRNEIATAERKRLADDAAQAQALADAAAAAGDAEAAEELQAQADASTNVIDLISSAPSVPVVQTRVAGISMGERWSAEVTDLMELVKAVAAGTVPLEAIVAETKFLNNQARALKANLKYPGVRSFNTPTMSARAA